jgi:H+/Cl- antiporter ClcA
VLALPSRPTTPLLGPVVVTGLLGGAVGAAYLGLLHVLTRGLGPDRWSPGVHVGVLAGVGLAVAVLVRWLGRPADVELLVDDIHVDGGSPSLHRVRSLLPASLLCVAAGGTLGPEAPLVTTTGSLGSWVADRRGLDRSDRRIVSIAGMAAGFTVLFGAPLGSALFALEILHRRGLEYYEALLPAALGSLCGYGVYVAVTGLGLDPVFPFPSIVDLHVASLGWSIAAGVAGAAIAAAFTGLVAALRWSVGRVPSEARPLLGGLVLGCLALASPYALTNGEAQLDHLNAVTVAAGTLAVAAVVKLLGAAVSVVTGWKGGFIIPLFFVGYCVGRLAGPHLPGGDAWVLAAATMAAANVGVTKTPLGSTLVVTEMAGTAVLPTTLIASLVALFLTSGVSMIDSQRRRFQP